MNFSSIRMKNLFTLNQLVQMNLISSLNESKSAGPNSLITKILKHLKNNVLLQMTNIFNLSFSAGVFPSGFTYAKVIPIQEKKTKIKMLKI